MNAAPELTLIPLSMLADSPLNVRKSNGQDVTQLAAMIRSQGLLQNLTVTKGKGNRYEVVAGGRRHRALKLLAKNKEIEADHLVNCLVIKSADALQASLAENIGQLPMHPADQFDAFHALGEKGMGVGDIAARFGVSELVVRQRLKLANVAPSLLNLYREGKMGLETLQAFAISNDIKQQEHLWATLPEWQRKQPRDIIRALTKAELNVAEDRYAKLVGFERYKAAGGSLRHDLFSTDVFFADAALVQKLAGQVIEDYAKRLRAQGWKWVTLFVKGDHLSMHDYGRKKPKTIETTPDQDRELAAIDARRKVVAGQLDALPTDNDGYPLDRVTEGELDAEIATLDAREEDIRGELLQWSSKTKAESGAILELNRDGKLIVHRGLVSKADAKASAATPPKGKTKTGAKAEPASAPAALSDAMYQTLTGYRSAVIASQLMSNTNVMLAVLVNALVGDLNHNGYTTRLGEFRASQSQSNHDRVVVPDHYPARVDIASHKAAWLKAIPEAADKRMAYLLACDKEQLLDILSAIVANAFEGITGAGANSNGGGHHDVKLGLVEQVATALGLDMADHWEATRETYFSRIPKDLAIAAIADACGADAAKPLGSLKKGDAAAKAEELVAGKRWLPKPLLLRQTKAAK
jgi:ParB family chromosome partitioning protein